MGSLLRPWHYTYAVPWSEFPIVPSYPHYHVCSAKYTLGAGGHPARLPPSGVNRPFPRGVARPPPPPRPPFPPRSGERFGGGVGARQASPEEGAASLAAAAAATATNEAAPREVGGGTARVLSPRATSCFG